MWCFVTLNRHEFVPCQLTKREFFDKREVVIAIEWPKHHLFGSWSSFGKMIEGRKPWYMDRKASFPTGPARRLCKYVADIYTCNGTRGRPYKVRTRLFLFSWMMSVAVEYSVGLATLSNGVIKPLSTFTSSKLVGSGRELFQFCVILIANEGIGPRAMWGNR